MAKKNKRVEKETRRLIEGIADLVKKKGDRYKFKTGKKKEIKKIKKTCMHWTIGSKGKEIPAVIKDPQNPNNWKCQICQASFPIRPKTSDEYEDHIQELIGIVNQTKLFSVGLGGNAEDTKLLIQLTQLLIRYKKVTKNILKQVNKRQEWEDRKQKTDTMSQFDSYSGFNYRS